MIEYIKGIITELTPTYCILESHDIGYRLNISLVSYGALQGKTQAQLYVYESIREDEHLLFGFTEKSERELFLLLISVSGIGANTARMILSSLTVSELQEAIATGNVNAIKAVKGIGIKSAQRIIVDLKDKVGKIGGDTIDFTVVTGKNEKAEEALAGLMALGFQQQASAKIIEKILKAEPDLEVARIIKRALSMI